MLSISTSNTTVKLTDLTHATVAGNGVFDVLMRAVKAHLEQEWTAGRIKGTEYSTVYLSALQTTLQTALQFVLSQEKTNQEIELVKAQIEVQKQQAANLLLEAANIPKQGIVLDKQALDLVAATALKGVQVSQVTAETLNIPKQGQLIDAQTGVQNQQAANLSAEAANIPKQGLLIDAQRTVQTQQAANLLAEASNIPKQGLLIDANKLKADAEKGLLDQKKVTEVAQVDGSVVNASSVIGKENAVRTEQAITFVRDAEQKAAKLMVEFMSAAVVADSGQLSNVTTANLNAASIGSVVTKLKQGIGA
jgi:hypothetical protein